MVTHSSVLPWRIPGTEEPGGLQSRGRKSQTRPNNWTTTIAIYLVAKQPDSTVQQRELYSMSCGEPQGKRVWKSSEGIRVQLFATAWAVVCQPPVSGISQARMLEWVSISSSRGYTYIHTYIYIYIHGLPCKRKYIYMHLCIYISNIYKLKYMNVLQSFQYTHNSVTLLTNRN